MNLRSIHFRLTLWYSLGLIIGAALVFSAFYIITRQTLLAQTDSTISSHAEGIISLVTSNIGPDSSGIFSREIITQQFSEMPGMLVVIADAAGKTISGSQTVSVSNQAITSLLEKSAAIIRPTFSERTVGTTILRIGIFPVIIDGVTSNLVLVGHPVDVIYQSLSSLSLTLLGIFLLLLLPIIIGGYYLSRRALSPVADLAKQLEKITSQNLNESLKEPHTGDEVQKLVLNFNDLLQRLHTAFERERRFISDVTHELKTPLATIRAGVEVGLSRTRSEEEYRQILNESLVDIERLAGTLNNVLDLAWSEAEQSKELVEVLDLSKLTEEISQLCVKLAQKKRIKVESAVNPEIFIAGREDKVFRALLNIVDNAVKYTLAKGQINIRLLRGGNQAVLTVSDNGIGISREELPKVFNRFYRGPRTTATLGSGLGLAIAKGIINAHRGEITIISRVGGGTSVVITLPTIER